MNNNEILIKGAEAVSLFCRLHVNAKKNLPIRSSEMGLLILTVKNEIPVTPLMAAEFFKVKKPMITAMMASLCKGGYLTKVPSMEDRRSFTLVPTKKAKALVENTYQEYFRTLELLFEGMGKEDFKKFITLTEQANSILLEDKTNEN